MNSSFDTLIVGGGPAGCVLANKLSAGGTSVGLLEAGPDYGTLDSGEWPADLLDGRGLTWTHNWSQPESADVRGRVIGGGSSVNGCWSPRASALDFAAWAEATNGCWDADALLPALERAEVAMRVRAPETSELGAWHREVLTAAEKAGFAYGDPDLTDGPCVGMSRANTYKGFRWNAALAYLQDVRDRTNLTIIGNANVHRLRCEDDAVVSVEAEVNGQLVQFNADRIIVAAGAMGSAALLLRSGIGPAGELEQLGIAVTCDLPGVGKGMRDHVGLGLWYAPSAELVRRCSEPGGLETIAQIMVKAKSSLDNGRTFDVHVSSAAWWEGERLVSNLYPFLLDARSEGEVTISSADPSDPPVVDHKFLSDPHGHDLAGLIEATLLGREMGRTLVDEGVVDAEVDPGPIADSEIGEWVRSRAKSYWHHVGTCRMGTDDMAVVDHHGQVHGFQNLQVIDSSIFPILPSANTMVPTAMLAEAMAEREMSENS